MLPKLNDSGEEVKFWQYTHNAVRTTVDPDAPELTVDGSYGPKTASAFLAFWKAKGGASTTYRGEFMTGWLAYQYHRALVQRLATPGPRGLPGRDGVDGVDGKDGVVPDRIMLRGLVLETE